MIERLKPAVSAALGSPVRSHVRARGGDINEAFDVTLADGRRIFVKTHAHADPRMFACEAHGLDWLRAAFDATVAADEGDAPDTTTVGDVDADDGTAVSSHTKTAKRRHSSAKLIELRIPRVLAYSSPDDGDTPPFLALEWIAPAPRAADFDERLGRGLAALHARTPAAFGFDEPNFIGNLPQDNTPADAWTAFYASRRLEPQVRAAVDRGHAPGGWIRAFSRLFARMEDLAGPAEPAARLHGDLWSGNVMSDEQGAPCLIDPAVYGGHREVDLAMLRLFGGLTPRCLAAYHEAAPLAAGHQARVPLYQLYPLLVHVNLFGGSYVSAVEQALDAYS